MNHLFRIDIANPTGQQPKLVGLAIRGYGWLLGGSSAGDLSIAIMDDGSWVPFDTGHNTQAQVDRFRKKHAKFSYHCNGHKNWPVRDDDFAYRPPSAEPAPQQAAEQLTTYEEILATYEQIMTDTIEEIAEALRNRCRLAAEARTRVL